MEVNEKSPEIILAQLREDLCGMKYEVLYLHTPNEYDTITTYRYYYYDSTGEEISEPMIIKYIEITDKLFEK